MQIGVVFPQSELGGDVAAVREYGTGVEQIGYSHLLAYDHVVGADPEVHKGWAGPYDIDTTFHEPLVMFGYLAGATDLELVTGIIIAPQRPTALIAKQAAEVDLLTGGKFRLGVGIGWNPVEYDALGQDFSRRGRRLDEQVPLLRQLWTERSVTFEGERERITAAGLAPLPIQRPIPVWFGGASEPAYRRIGRLADGWFPMLYPGDQLDAARATIRDAAEAAGRDVSDLPMEGRVRWLGDDQTDEFRKHVDRWRGAGASHLSVDTMRCGFASTQEHVDALGRAWQLMQG